MSITANVPVPTSYRRLHEKKIFNVPARLLLVWGVAVTAFGFLAIELWRFGVTNMFYDMLIFFIIGGLTYAVARDLQTLDKSKLHVILIYRIIRNKNIVKKYVEHLDDLKKAFPVETVEETGLIRYTNQTSGFLIMMDPPRIAEDDLERHSIRMRNVINSLYGQFTFQFITTSVQDSSNPLTRATVEAMQNKDNSIQVNNHLNSLYLESLNQQNVIHWRFILLVTVPHTKTTEEAEKLKHAFISGLSKELSRAEIFCRLIDNRTEIIRIMRDCAC